MQQRAPGRTLIWNQNHLRQILHEYEIRQSAPAAPLAAWRCAADTATRTRSILSSSASEDTLASVAW